MKNVKSPRDRLSNGAVMYGGTLHYDANGNLVGTVEETYGGVWSVSEEWQYDWNPRDQMTRAMMGVGGSGTLCWIVNPFSIPDKRRDCLACDGALSKRFVYGAGSGSTKGALESGRLYEYDGLSLQTLEKT